jgi:plastocyanin
MITFKQGGVISPGTSVTIKAGSNVIWCNNDPYNPHGIQAIAVQTGKYFGMRMIPYRGNFTVSFPVAGSFTYTTTFQPLQTGVITVTK